MKYIYALAAGVAFGTFVDWIFLVVVSLSGKHVGNWISFKVGPIFAGLSLILILLFIDKIKNK